MLAGGSGVLAGGSGGLAGPPSVEGLAAALGEAPPHTLALAITNSEVMGVGAELTTGRALRQAALAAALAADTAKHDPDRGPFACEIAGAAQAAAVFSAIWRWAGLGAGSHSLEREVASALGAVAELGAVAAPGAVSELGTASGAADASGSPADAAGLTDPSLLADAAVLADPSDSAVLRVAVIGVGAIGARVIEELAAGRVARARLAGVVTRRPEALAGALGSSARGITDFGRDLSRAIAESDLVVECAGIAAARESGARVVAAGRDLLLVSIGALADPASRAALTGGPGTLRLATGAIGGLDLLASAARPGGIPRGIERASMTSAKAAGSLVQPWMGEAEAARLRSATEPFVLFEGTVAEAVELYPGSLNVACALAHATGLWDEVRVRLVADPGASRTTHEISASGAAGDYTFVMENAVSAANPASSAVVAESVLRGVAELAAPGGAFA